MLTLAGVCLCLFFAVCWGCIYLLCFQLPDHSDICRFQLQDSGYWLCELEAYTLLLILTTVGVLLLVRDGCVLIDSRTGEHHVSLSFALLTCLSVLHHIHLCTCLWALTLEEGSSQFPEDSVSFKFVQFGAAA